MFFMCVVAMVFLMGWLTLVLGVGWLDGLGFGLGGWVCQSCGTILFLILCMQAGVLYACGFLYACGLCSCGL